MPLQDRKQRQFVNREREILVAALELCSTPDWETVTVSEIARRAEVGKGTLYKHFASKDELLFRLMMDFYRGLLDILRTEQPAEYSPISLLERLSGGSSTGLRLPESPVEGVPARQSTSPPTNPPGSPLEQLRAAVERALRYHADHREYRYVVAYCDRIDFKERAHQRWQQDFLELDHAFMAWASPILESGMEQGLIEPRPVDHLMLGISAAFKGAIAMIWSSEDWCPLGDKETVIVAVRDFVIAALVGRYAEPKRFSSNCEQGQETGQR
ncbi:MAG: TetR family transcriptional regulator [Gammaproteobacteria bacterium]|jgi:AcrR family transcriptional regulator|nr:TetR family transcriptional regulator [Gammaproteobacteria bacterium]